MQEHCIECCEMKYHRSLVRQFPDEADCEDQCEECLDVIYRKCGNEIENHKEEYK